MYSDLRPAAFDGAIGGKRPMKSELEQLLGPGDHKPNRLSPLLPVLPGLPVHITQNIAPKLGVATGSTGTIVGCQFRKGTVFKPMYFQECPMRLASKPPEIIYVSVDQASLKNRFQKAFQITQCLCCRLLLLNRTFSVKITQIPIASVIAATIYNLQGMT